MPTATWKSRLRSGSAHCDLQLAVEVRQCPLGSGARGGGPAVPTGIWTARRRRRVRRRRRQRRRRRRRRTALIKSNNPHLAGGEKKTYRIAVRRIPQQPFQSDVFVTEPAVSTIGRTSTKVARRKMARAWLKQTMGNLVSETFLWLYGGFVLTYIRGIPRYTQG